jgi:hypothetical protein
MPALALVTHDVHFASDRQTHQPVTLIKRPCLEAIAKGPTTAGENRVPQFHHSCLPEYVLEIFASAGAQS